MYQRLMVSTTTMLSILMQGMDDSDESFWKVGLKSMHLVLMACGIFKAVAFQSNRQGQANESSGGKRACCHAPDFMYNTVAPPGTQQHGVTDRGCSTALYCMYVDYFNGCLSWSGCCSVVGMRVYYLFTFTWSRFSGLTCCVCMYEM